MGVGGRHFARLAKRSLMMAYTCCIRDVYIFIGRR